MRIFYITFLPDMSYPDLRIIVLSPYCLLRPTTNRIYDMRMSDALAGHGAEVEIVYPYIYAGQHPACRDPEDVWHAVFRS